MQNYIVEYDKGLGDGLETSEVIRATSHEDAWLRWRTENTDALTEATVWELGSDKRAIPA